MPSLVLGVAFALVAALPARAATTATSLKTVSFTAETLSRGFSFTDESKQFRLLINPQTFSTPATVTVERVALDTVPAWERRLLESDLYRVTVNGADGLTLLRSLSFEFSVPVPGFMAYIGKLSADQQSWEELGFSLSASGIKARSSDDKLSFTVALFQHEGRQEGVATYYGTYARKTKLTFVAASNTFPNGTVLRVTNLDNEKTVTVKVVDTGAFTYPRVIDLSTPAFARIQPTWKGVARVRVEKATPWNRPSPGEPPVEEPPHTGTPVSDGATPPTTAATASIVVDVASGQKLAGKKTDVAMPIASLTKVMTAAVFMDTKPDLNRVVTYDRADNAICSCLHLAAGEAVRLKDLLYASLVGSANNATLALVRFSGLSTAEFVARMNVKAQQLGLKETSYVEPSGLDAGNVGSAEDLAVIFRKIPDAYPTIKKILGTGKYSFTSQNTTCLAPYRQKDGSCTHSFVTTNKLYGKTSFTIVAAKTGFIDEARHTLLLRGKNKQGHEVVLVFLKVYRKQDSFSYANRLIDWAFEHYRWV